MGTSPGSDQTQQQRAITSEHEERSFRLALTGGVFGFTGFRLVNPRIVLAAFVKELTKSNILVGLTSSTMHAGWMWPQLFVSNLLEHRPRKMPFYIFGVTMRIIAWLFILLLTLLIGNNKPLLLFFCFYSLYFMASSCLGVSAIPHKDIVAKSIPIQKRGRLFSFQQLISGTFGIGVGFLIRYVLSEEFYLSFPYNYTILFGLAMLMMMGAAVSFALVREPIHPVRDVRQPFWQHLKRGPHFLRTDRDYRYFMVFRMVASFGNMCAPFYVPYALDRIGIARSTIGSFTVAASVSAAFSIVLWAYMCEKRGSKSLLIATSSLACVAPMIAASVRYLPAAHQTTSYFLVFIISEALLSGSFIAYMTYTINMAPSMSRPTYLGFLDTSMFPMSFVPVLAGALLKIMSYERMFILSAGMSVLAVYFATNLSNVDKRDDIESK